MKQKEDSSLYGEMPGDDLIEIVDPEIDPQAIMAEIRDRIQKRREELGYVPQQFSTFGGTKFPGRPDDVPYNPDYYDHLEMANELYREIDTEVDLQPSPALRVPVLGTLWATIREQAHQLVLYYVNRASAQQMSVNRELVSVLNISEEIMLKQQRAIIKLQNDVYLLRQQLAEKEG
jgi:hypothetical protein